MKEDILEQIVDDYLQFQGYFTTHNVRFKPYPAHLDYVADLDRVPSDVDVVALHPTHTGPDLNDDVDGVLRVADNWVHMNGAALDFYAHAEPDGRLIIDIDPDTQGAKMLLSAVRYHYAIVSVSNEVLGLGQEGRLGPLWTEFGAIYGKAPRDSETQE
jgi:hypothetical protein